ncbi:Sushi, von Willebrand factor type A, EGF and pentraxin domain-containing protein 1, partial [Ophiophagus hannah]
MSQGLLIFLFQSVLVQNQVDNKCGICGQNALCKNVSGNYSCSCERGFWTQSNQTKTFLNSSVDKCISCQNYSTKVDTCKNGYKLCSSGGDKCCASATNCQHKKCGRYATCVRDCDDFLCKCKPGFLLPNGGSEFKSVNEDDCKALKVSCIYS